MRSDSNRGRIILFGDDECVARQVKATSEKVGIKFERDEPQSYYPEISDDLILTFKMYIESADYIFAVFNEGEPFPRSSLHRTLAQLISLTSLHRTDKAIIVVKPKGFRTPLDLDLLPAVHTDTEKGWQDQLVHLIEKQEEAAA